VANTPNRGRRLRRAGPWCAPVQPAPSAPALDRCSRPPAARTGSRGQRRRQRPNPPRKEFVKRATSAGGLALGLLARLEAARKGPSNQGFREERGAPTSTNLGKKGAGRRTGARLVAGRKTPLTIGSARQDGPRLPRFSPVPSDGARTPPLCLVEPGRAAGGAFGASRIVSSSHTADPRQERPKKR